MIIISELQEYTIHCPLVVYIIILKVPCKIIFAFVLQSSCIRDFIFKGLWRAEFLKQGEVHFPADWIIVGKEGERKEKVVYVAKSDTEHFSRLSKTKWKRRSDYETLLNIVSLILKSLCPPDLLF